MDIKRLEAAMNKVSSRSIPGKETAPAASEDESKAKKKISLEDRKKSAALNMINNLAREKFGERFSIQSSPKKTNLRKTRMLRQKVIIPKPNKALRDRVSMAKKARQQEDSKNMFESPASRSLALEPNQSGFLRQPFFRLDDALETEEPSEAWRKTNDAVTRIELADDELTHILRYRPQDPLPVRQMETFCNPVQLICDLSVQIVDEMVRNVSKEMLNDEIVAKMMHMELKERV